MLPALLRISMDTWWYYKAAHLIDQSWSVRAAGFRQRHIDQAQSMNLYITNDYSMRQVLRLYLEAWRPASRPFIMSAARPLRSRPVKAARHKEDSMMELKKKPLFNPERP